MEMCSTLRMASDPNILILGLSIRLGRSKLMSMIGRSTVDDELIDKDDIETVDMVVSSSLFPHSLFGLLNACPVILRRLRGDSDSREFLFLVVVVVSDCSTIFRSSSLMRRLTGELVVDLDALVLRRIGVRGDAGNREVAASSKEA